jgi:pyocin large subunit-like protein
MSRPVLKLVILAVILAGSWFLGLPKNQPASAPTPATTETRAPAAGGRSARETWGRIESLPDHFARHGRDFHARDPDDYAAQAAAFLQRAKAAGLPAKRDADGSLRVFDPATGTFGAYNRDGTTKTFFKPGNADYFDRQPGERIDLRTAR